MPYLSSSLALTGLNIIFGKDLLLPLIGPDAFSRWSMAAEFAHDYSSFPNGLTGVDVWSLQGGGVIGHEHPPASKFNGGQKVLFWLVVLGTIGVAVTGVFLLFPFSLTDILGQRIAQIIHAVMAIFLSPHHRPHLYRDLGHGGRV